MSKELDQFSMRLREALNEYGLEEHNLQTATAKLFNVSPRAAAFWLKAETYPKMDKLIEITKKLNVSLDWLLTGRGNKMKEKTTKTDKQFIDIFEALPKEAKKEIISYAAYVLERIEERKEREITSKGIRSLIK